MLVLLAVLQLFATPSANAAGICLRVAPKPNSLYNLAAVFNEQPFDNRVYRSGKDEPIYRAVGKVRCGDNSGTGFFLGHCTIITSHHFWSECEKDGVSTDVTMDYDHKGSGFEKTKKLNYVTGGDSTDEVDLKRLKDLDWVAMRPEGCEDKDFPHFSVCDSKPKVKRLEGVRLAGLFSDRDSSLGISVDESCRIYDGNFENVGHDCASRKMTSGAPLFTLEGDKYCLLAVHTVCYSDADKCENGITSKFYEDKTFNFAVPVERFKADLPADE